jgi:exodeoxyribonuclease V alpha subunit
MEQLMQCPNVPVFRLTKNHRIESLGDNGILLNATRIVDLSKPLDEDDPESYVPFSFTPSETFQILEGTAERVYDIIQALYSAGVPAEDSIIITPYNKELNELNKMFQQIYNDGQRSFVDPKGKLWMLKDRVMMLENCYDIDVMNGQMGTVVDILDTGESPGVSVVFNDGVQHTFRFTTTDEIENDAVKDKEHNPEDNLTVKMICHAYCVTCHKSQGSEWPYVVVFVPEHKQNTTFLNRNLIYTAITRAKKGLWLVTPSLKEITESVMKKPMKRCDNLAKRVVEEIVPLGSEVPKSPNPEKSIDLQEGSQEGKANEVVQVVQIIDQQIEKSQEKCGDIEV